MARNFRRWISLAWPALQPRIPREYGTLQAVLFKRRTRSWLFQDPVAIPQQCRPSCAFVRCWALPVVNSISRAFLSFPFSHPLFQGSVSLIAADLVLVIDADIPWMPGPAAPGPDCYVAVIDTDPVKQKFPTFEFPANLRLTADPLLAITALIEALQPLITVDHKSRFATRAAEWGKASDQKIRALQKEAAGRANSASNRSTLAQLSNR